MNIYPFKHITNQTYSNKYSFTKQTVTLCVSYPTPNQRPKAVSVEHPIKRTSVPKHLRTKQLLCTEHNRYTTYAPQDCVTTFMFAFSCYPFDRSVVCRHVVHFAKLCREQRTKANNHSIRWRAAHSSQNITELAAKKEVNINREMPNDALAFASSLRTANEFDSFVYMWGMLVEEGVARVIYQQRIQART